MKTWLPWTLLALSLALNIFLVAGYFWARSATTFWHDPESRFERVAERLDLTEPQRADFRRILAAFKERGGMAFEAHRAARREILEMALQPNPDREAILARIEALSRERTQAMAELLDLSLPFLASLSPEQRAELKELLEKRRRGHWGGGWGWGLWDGHRMGWAN